MSDPEPLHALIVLGCPEVPVQNSLAVYATWQLKKSGYSVLISGNPAVIKLLLTSDPERHYISTMTTLEKTVEGLSTKAVSYQLCIAFAHSDAGICYAATMRYLLPEARFITVVFGREAEKIADLIEYEGEQIVVKAVHDPLQIKKRLQEVLGWAASKT